MKNLSFVFKIDEGIYFPIDRFFKSLSWRSIYLDFRHFKLFSISGGWYYSLCHPSSQGYVAHQSGYNISDKNCSALCFPAHFI